MADGTVLGRTAELDRIERLIGAIPGGPRALTVVGEPGIGKTALWSAALQATVSGSGSDGRTVLTARAAASERTMPHVVLADLLGLIGADAMASLPGPQAAAIGAALLLDGAGPVDGAIDPRAIATAVLNLLRWATRDGPLVLGIDDVHWIDAASAAALGFALRRAVAARLPVGLLVTRRGEAEDGRTVADGIPGVGPPDRSSLDLVDVFGDAAEELTLGPVSLGVLHRLIRERTGASLTRPRLARLEEATGGNPLLAIEIGRELARIDRWPLPGEPLPVPADIRQLVAQRMHRLPPLAVDALFAAATMTAPTVDALAAALDVATTDVREVVHTAIEVALLGPSTVDDVLRFVHPTIEAAVLDGPPADRRRALHRRLAGLASTDEERGRHVALAVDGPDRTAAAMLDAAAAAARRRGAPGVAAAWAEQAAQHSAADEPGRRDQRALRAARWWAESGEVMRGRAGLERIVAEAPAGDLRAEARLALAQIVGWDEGPEAMLSIAEAALAEAMDQELRARIHLRIASGSDHRPAVVRCAAADAAVSTLRSMTDRDPDPDLLACALLQSASFRFDAGLADDEASVQAAVALLADEPRATGESDERAESYRAHALAWEWADDHDRIDEALSAALRDLARARARGLDRPLPIVETEVALLLVRAGRWDAAAEHAHAALEAADLAGNAEGRRAALGGLAMLALVRGELETAADRIAQAEPPGGGTDDWLGVRHRAIAGGIDLVRGNARQAVETLGPLLDEQVALGHGETLQYRFAGDLVEAALASGDVERAKGAVAVLAESVTLRPRPWVRVVAARCQALLSAAGGDLDAAQAAIHAALRHATELPMPLEHARTELVAGRIARRRKERRRAADHLQRAIEGLRSLGAGAWLAIAEAEVARLGRRASRPDALTETELQVARLAASGMTNREVGEAAFLTAKSVEGVLARVYPKLGIRSRAELGAWLAATAEDEPTD